MYYLIVLVYITRSNFPNHGIDFLFCMRSTIASLYSVYEEEDVIADYILGNCAKKCFLKIPNNKGMILSCKLFY